MTSARQLTVRTADPAYEPQTIRGFTHHTIQRIAGIPAHAYSNGPRFEYRLRTRAHTGVPWIIQRTIRGPRPQPAPFDTYEPNFTAQREAAEAGLSYRFDGTVRYAPDPAFDKNADPNDNTYDGWNDGPDIPDPFNTNDPWVAARTPRVTIHQGERPDLEAEADRILEAGNQQLITQVPGLLERQPKPVWKLGPRTIHTYAFKPIAYKLGFKPCPRCGGNRPFAQPKCHYCKGAGGWPITRSKLVPVWLYDGTVQDTPPIVTRITRKGHVFLRTPAQPSIRHRYSPPWRTRGPYYGDARTRRLRIQPEVLAEFARRKQAYAQAQRRYEELIAA